MAAETTIPVAASDLKAAWLVLENLAVSLDRIGGSFAVENKQSNGIDQIASLREALETYFTPALVRDINQARVRLGKYLSDDEAEALTNDISYWRDQRLMTSQK